MTSVMLSFAALAISLTRQSAMGWALSRMREAAFLIISARLYRGVLAQDF